MTYRKFLIIISGIALAVFVAIFLGFRALEADNLFPSDNSPFTVIIMPLRLFCVFLNFLPFVATAVLVKLFQYIIFEYGSLILMLVCLCYYLYFASIAYLLTKKFRNEPFASPLQLSGMNARIGILLCLVVFTAFGGYITTLD
jgi:hypothetical protein